MRHFRLDKGDDRLPLLDTGNELPHAVSGPEVALRTEDEDVGGALDVAFQVGDVVKVVHVQETGESRDHLAEALLQDSHLVLTRPPHVRKEEMEAFHAGKLDDLIGLDVPQPLIPQLLLLELASPLLQGGSQPLLRRLKENKEDGEEEGADHAGEEACREDGGVDGKAVPEQAGELSLNSLHLHERVELEEGTGKACGIQVR